MHQLAQASPAQIEEFCGVGLEGGVVCRLVARYTSNELLLAAAGIGGTLLRILLIVILAIVFTRLARTLVSRFARQMHRRIEAQLEDRQRKGALAEEKYRSRRLQRLKAITGVMRGVAGVLVWLIAILMIVQAVGISLQPVLAGAGLISVVIGFGAQQLVRDVLAGIAMLIEDQYGVGDWIDVDGVIGQVERVGLRTTSFRDLDGIQHHVLNGYIQRVGNLSQEWSRSLLDIPVALDTDVPTAKEIVYSVANDLAQDPVWGADIIGPPEIWGIQDFAPDGLSIRLVMPTKPFANWDINRQLRERLHHAFTRANIRMPAALREVGGLATGHPVLNRRVGDAPFEHQPLTGHRSTAETRTEHREPGREDAAEPVSGATIDEITGEDPYEDMADRTTELRIIRGRELRPD